MNIGPHTFMEFKQKAAEFHSYPAPGLLIGGYMVELARSLLPADTLFEAVVETPKCLPDAVQLLTPLSTGNGWVKVVNLGRYALCLYDKHTGQGWRVFLDPAKLGPWPGIADWFMKLTPKEDQDTARLYDEIERAGDTICGVEPVRVRPQFREKTSMGRLAVCPVCGEAYPARDGGICRGCQGEAPYEIMARNQPGAGPTLRAVPVEEAVGHRALHDMTRIVPGESKDPAVSAGQVISAGDLCALHRMGRGRVYVEDQAETSPDWVHENEAALAYAQALAGAGIEYDETPREGKVVFRAALRGLLVVDRDRLHAFNMVPDVMCATRQDCSVVDRGKQVAGCRAIPLYISRRNHNSALAVVSAGAVFSVKPLRPARVGILVTGTEVFQGIIEDRFAPIIKSKVEALGCRVVEVGMAPDDRRAIADGVRRLLEAGADLVVTTAGLSVDPDDVTRLALYDAGLTDALYGTPILPGAMTIVGRIRGPAGEVQVLGVPACAIFFKTTSLDLLLPRMLANVPMTRRTLAQMADGGLCLGCKACRYPRCPFGK
ncbi:MAG: FmdE family protein [Desulfovibrionaceae bacterium]